MRGRDADAAVDDLDREPVSAFATFGARDEIHRIGRAGAVSVGILEEVVDDAARGGQVFFDGGRDTDHPWRSVVVVSAADYERATELIAVAQRCGMTVTVAASA